MTGATALETGRSTGKRKPLGPGALDGKRFLESLDDGRSVWLNGERIDKVATHPLFRAQALEMARIYDLQHQEGTREAMTFVNPNGVRVSCSYLEPRDAEGLMKRRRNAEIWAAESFGMMGRYPDFCASVAVGFKDCGDELAKLDPMFAQNAAWHHQYAAENDLCLGHGLHDPNMDKTLRPEQDPDRCLRIVKERDDGIVVRGARFVTLGPFSHEMQIAPTFMLNEREADHALWFAVPSNAPRLKMICREAFSNRSRFEHPASSRFDEQDTLVIFDDVFVPWERVFLARRPAEANRLFRSRVMVWAVFAAAVQLLARLELLIGTGYLLARTGGMDDRPHVQQELGELITYKRIFADILRAAEIDHQVTPNGLLAPGNITHQRAFIGMISERIIDIMEHIGTSSLIFNPSEKDFAVPELRPLLDLYGRGRGVDALTRTKLCKLAWDLTGDAFGGRQQLYERLHSGDPKAVLAGVYQRYDKAPAVAMVERLTDTKF
ncbi:4-hydroxyphenylacetate 3-monooxygenase/anthranilate 3-monooxygenase (FAD) / 4-hydroxyphenylacetate 3-monooxygenase [Rhizobiales bacterium GAS113]|nr:4-hydroxyphenylacetate 3-monooxygenase/anthranilate 3-monooxygenase (FAD) / 4-hydroxyphenylacetate 3-monooxygenase [Rhizobiales bacterium GAS113]